ncbi:transcription antitermination factor NusB [Chloroflexota bacterium]
MAGVRRKARVTALKALYEFDCAGHEAEGVARRLAEENGLPEEAASYAQELIRGILENRERIDALVEESAPSWPIDQLSLIDRNILRLAILEILIDNKVPPKAAINEAVELAKTFGSNNSAKFINGVLGTVSTKQDFK